jgi:hypothetical protein
LIQVVSTSLTRTCADLDLVQESCGSRGLTLFHLNSQLNFNFNKLSLSPFFMKQNSPARSVSRSSVPLDKVSIKSNEIVLNLHISPIESIALFRIWSIKRIKLSTEMLCKRVFFTLWSKYNPWWMIRPKREHSFVELF